MKKIAFVFPPLLPLPAVKGGATETLIQRLIDDNEQQGKFRFDIFCRYDPEAEKAAGSYQNTRFFYIKDGKSLGERVIFLGFRLRRKFSKGYTPEPYLKKVTAHLEREGYDAIIVESALRFIPYIKKCTGRPTLLHLHFDGVNSNQPNKREAFSCCDGVICVSRFIESTVRGFDASVKTVVLQNVTDTAYFERDSHMRQAEALRQRYGISIADKVVLYAGRLLQVKGVMELVRAFRRAQETVPELKMFLVGSVGYGETVHDAFYEQLREEIGPAWNESIFMTGYVPHNEIADFYAMTDIAVMPTIGVEEASGLSALEPLSSGCFFIGSNSGGIPEVANCAAATIIPRGDGFVQQLAEAICKKAKGADAPLGDGRAHVLKNHDARDYYGHFMDCLQEIV